MHREEGSDLSFWEWVFGLFAVFSGLLTAYFASLASAYAYLALTGLNRPNLTIIHVSANESNVREGKFYPPNYKISNSGQTAAVYVSIREEFVQEPLSNPPVPSKIFEEKYRWVTEAIRGGEMVDGEQSEKRRIDNELKLTDTQLIIEGGELGLFWFGYLEYYDIIRKDSYKYYFRYKYSIEKKDFEISGGRDANYHEAPSWHFSWFIPLWKIN